MIDPRLQQIMDAFTQQFPDVRITSGYRSPTYNAQVGGARNSQHTHGTAFDFSVRGLPAERQQQMAEFLRQQGAQGFGYYPNNQSMHADIGPARFWGPDYRSTSLGQTPEWFQRFAGVQNPAAPAATPMGDASDPRRGLLAYTGQVQPQGAAPLASAPAPAADGAAAAAPSAPANPLMQRASGGLLAGGGNDLMKMAQAQEQRAAQDINNLYRMAAQNPARAVRPQANLAGLLG